MATKTRQTLDQQRAAFAWRCVEHGCTKDYVALVSGAPALVSSNGLLQALAYYHQKKGDANELAGHILGWLHEQLGLPNDFPNFMSRAVKLKSHAYMQATEEVLEFLRFLRQFAKANQKQKREAE